MLYYLFEYLDRVWDIPGAGVFRFISFRAAMAIIISLFITLFLGKPIIRLLLKKQVGETIRDLGLDGQAQKKGTPTMGGLIILSAILIPTFLLARLDNIYVILMIVSTVWLGVIGFLDDYIKVFKKDKEGLAGRFKIIGQVGLGLIVGSVLYFHDDVVVRQNSVKQDNVVVSVSITENRSEASGNFDTKSTKTTIPFFKDNEFDYRMISSLFGDESGRYVWVIFILVVILIVTAVSNGANITMCDEVL